MENNRKINDLDAILENLFSKTFVWLQKSYLYLRKQLIRYPQPVVESVLINCL